MPGFDLPLQELERYRGAAVRPPDFDAYWDDSLAEMEALGAACDLLPADFQPPGARCFHLWFSGVGGARIHAKYLRPAARQGDVPAVLLFHGYHRDSGSWSSLLRYPGAGLCALAMDVRGQAGLSQDVGAVEGATVRGHVIRGATDPDPKKLLLRSVFLDAAQLARVAMALPGIDAGRVAAQGASQGGGIALACAALTPKLNRLAMLMPFLLDYPRLWALGDPEGTAWELHYHFRSADPRHIREHAFFERLGYVDGVNLAPRVLARTLLLTGLQDRQCPPSTQFAAYNAIRQAKRAWVYPESAHEVCPDMEDLAMAFLLEMEAGEA